MSDLFIPAFDSRKSTVKNYIIKILGAIWPMNPKGVYSIIKKRYAKKCTYQAVFKALGELKEEGIILKAKEGYQINLDWIKKLQAYTDTVETNYYAKERVLSLEGVQEIKGDEDLQILTFNNYFDAEKYLYYFIKHTILNMKNQSIHFRQIQHEWRPLFYLRTEYNYLKKLKDKNHKFFLLFNNSTPLDIYLKKLYENLGVKIKIKEESSTSFETQVIGDFIIQTFLPKEIEQQLNKFFKNTKNVSSIKVKGLIEDVFLKQSKIKVVITKDKDLAKKLISKYY